MRVVFDTNVLISAFIAQGMCSELLEYCGRQHRVIASDFILRELKTCLVGKFRYTEQEAAAAADLINSIAETVAPANLAMPVCRDHDDDLVLGTAVAGNAACIVTGDIDLLVLRQYRGIVILRPAEFIEFDAQNK
jgi:putative PIN family toxin of toxin-antitoxin system